MILLALNDKVDYQGIRVLFPVKEIDHSLLYSVNNGSEAEYGLPCLTLTKEAHPVSGAIEKV
jgi:hypothetical protein